MVVVSTLEETWAPVHDPLEAIGRIAVESLDVIDTAEGALIGATSDTRHVIYVHGAGYLSDAIGTKLELAGSLSGRAMRDEVILLTRDTRTDPRVNRGATEQLGVRSAICIPILNGHSAIGVMNVTSRHPGAFDETDVADLAELAEFVGVAVTTAVDLDRMVRSFEARRALGGSAKAAEFAVGVLDPTARELTRRRDRIERVVTEQRIVSHFQPVVRLDSGAAVAVEALARFPDFGSMSPARVFAEAHQVGLGVELEVAAVHRALARVASLSRHVSMVVSAGPDCLMSAEFHQAIQAAGAHRVVIELTEHAAVEDYTALKVSLDELRAMGAKLATDDTGAGMYCMAHVLQLAPDLVKLDRGLISGAANDPSRLALLKGLVEFVRQVGAEPVAQGIETHDELATLRDLGIPLGQGRLLSRPLPFSALPTALRQGQGAGEQDARGRASQRRTDDRDPAGPPPPVQDSRGRTS